jgi:hypothetical protein
LLGAIALTQQADHLVARSVCARRGLSMQGGRAWVGAVLSTPPRGPEGRCAKVKGTQWFLLSTEVRFCSGSAGFETARRETVWNGLLPKRFPDVIVEARDIDDVIASIRYAKEYGHQVGVRSGGHSWAASHLRDGGLLLDVSRLDHCTLDRDRKTADVGPGKVASVFAAELESQGLFLPTGHCEGICLGGYLVQGGYGWNSKVVGMGCESVLGLEVVTADGEQIYCDPDNHADLYRAARGSGPGFFGAMRTQCQPPRRHGSRPQAQRDRPEGRGPASTAMGRKRVGRLLQRE